jgi:capsular exopolysaccharide synthesis family protein
MEFHQYWLILKRRWLPTIAVFGSVSTLTVLTLLIQKPIYEAEGKLRFTKEDATSSLTGLLEGGVGEFNPLLEENNPISTEIEVIHSVPIIQETIDRLDLKDAAGEPLKRYEFLENLLLSSTKGTDILQIAYKHSDPEIAEKVVDTLMAIYLEKHLLDIRSNTTAARQFIEEQLPSAEADVSKADAELRRFKERNRIADLETEATKIVEASEDLYQHIAETQSELASVNAQAIAFSQQLHMTPQQAIAVTALSQSPGVQSVLTSLQDVESQLAIEQVRFQDAHPMIAALRTRKANLETLLDQRIRQTLGGQTIASTQNLQIGELQAELVGDYIRNEIKRRGLGYQVTVLNNAQATYKNRISEIPRLEQQQHELERKLEAAQTTYSLLLQRFHEIRIAEHQNVGNARIVQAASVFEDPIAPRKASYLMTGFLFGSVLAIVAALAFETFDKNLRNVKDARELFRLPLLGLIPLQRGTGRSVISPGSIVQSPSDLIVRDDPNSPIAEAYRLIQTNLKFICSKRALKSIVVTSSVPQEGKSFVSSNLALAIAQTGYKVLLIDADLRCPRQHSIWTVFNHEGLSQVIADQRDPQTLIHEVETNLNLLTSGITQLNPGVLLESQRLAALIEEFSNTYDYVIIDAPSVSVAADVPILGEIVDGILLVTRLGVVDVVNANLTKERLEQSGQNVLGQVINGVIDADEPYRYRYHQDFPDLRREEHLSEQSSSAQAQAVQSMKHY